jgi:hypothetical protein
MLAWTVALMAGALVGAEPQDIPGAAGVEDAPVRIDDVEVSGRRLRDEVGRFVEEVAAPPPGRGLARWNGALCIGTVNVEQRVARPLIDHVAAVALSYGLGIREPGCQPNVVVLFTDDGPGLASAIVTAEPKAFRAKWSSQLDHGDRELDVFQNAETPVRWWHISFPVIGATGQRAIRMPGDDNNIYVPGEGRVNKGRPIADRLNKVIIVVDLAKVENILLPELGDYLAMVALAQVDPNGDTSRHDTVLNLFSRPGSVHGLSGWDRAYLTSLYGAYPERISPYDHASNITRDIRRAERKEDAEAEN